MAYDSHAPRVESHDLHRRDRGHNSQQRTGPPRQQPLAHEHHSDRQQPDRQRWQVRLRQFLDKLDQAGNDAVRLHSKTEYLADLAQENTDCHTIEKADQNRAGKEVSQETEPEKARGNTEQTGEDGQNDR